MAQLLVEPITTKIPGVRDDKIYNDACSKDIEAYVLYAAMDNNEVYAYKDQACTEKVTYEEMRDMFLKGVVVCASNGNDSISYFKPSMCRIDAHDGDVKYAILYCDYWVYSAEYIER